MVDSSPVPNYQEPINDEILDRTTMRYPNHTAYTHLGCVLIRIALGSAIALKLEPKYKMKVILLLIVISLVFFIKYYKLVVKSNNVVWKAYLRTVFTYALSALFLYNGKQTMAGSIIIADALSAIQSRHSASVSSYSINLLKKNNDLI